MTDIRSKLKSNGLLYIINPGVEYESGIKLAQEYVWNASPIEKAIYKVINRYIDFSSVLIKEKGTIN